MFVYVVAILVESEEEEGVFHIETKTFDNKDAALKCRQDNPGSSYRKQTVLSQYHSMKD